MKEEGYTVSFSYTKNSPNSFSIMFEQSMAERKRCHTMVIYKPIPKKQRALILQGGVALGAYEAGVIKTLCKEVSEQIASDNNNNQNVFDIVAGTSIGAINAAILISGVVDRRKKLPPNTPLVERWQYSAENLVE